MTKKTQSNAQILEDLGELLAEDILELSDDEVWELAETTGVDTDKILARMRMNTQKNVSLSKSGSISTEAYAEVSRLIAKRLKAYLKGSETTLEQHRCPTMLPPRPDAGTSAQTTVPRGMVVFGSINVAQGSLIIDGEVEGDVQGTTVTIGATGVVKGDIVANTVLVKGHVKNVSASEVLLSGNAHVTGDVTHVALAMENGVVLAGQCHQMKIPGASNLGARTLAFAKHSTLCNGIFFMDGGRRHKD